MEFLEYPVTWNLVRDFCVHQILFAEDTTEAMLTLFPTAHAYPGAQGSYSLSAIMAPEKEVKTP